MAIRASDRNVVWARSAGRCSMCRHELAVDQQSGEQPPLGEIAHIVAFKKTWTSRRQQTR